MQDTLFTFYEPFRELWHIINIHIHMTKLPFHSNIYIYRLVTIGFFMIRKSNAFLSDYLTDLKLHSAK